jgi:hypothetical protein
MVRRTPPSESVREELLIKKLGARGWGRLHHFRHYYGPGWGDGAGRPVSPRALEGFYRFLERFEFPPGVKPSVFLTDTGHLEMCWEERTGKAVQIEFTPAGADYYSESTRREGCLGYAQISELVRELAVS